jgi:hypothetical protein
MELRKEFLNTEYMEKNLSMIQYDTTMLWHNITAIGITIIRYKPQNVEQDG